MSSRSATPKTYPYQNEPTWSKSEKAIARRAFDAALKRELRDVMRKTKQMANQIKEPADVWDLKHYLTERRKEIDRKYEYKYSVLLLVLADLVRAGRVSLDELDGLAEDKLRSIRDHAKVGALTPGR